MAGSSGTDMSVLTVALPRAAGPGAGEGGVEPAGPRATRAPARGVLTGARGAGGRSHLVLASTRTAAMAIAA